MGRCDRSARVLSWYCCVTSGVPEIYFRGGGAHSRRKCVASTFGAAAGGSRLPLHDHAHSKSCLELRRLREWWELSGCQICVPSCRSRCVCTTGPLLTSSPQTCRIQHLTHSLYVPGANPCCYSVLFFVGGLVLFRKWDTQARIVK